MNLRLKNKYRRRRIQGSFDILLPCVLDSAGRCKLPSTYSGDMLKLEKMLGPDCRVAGANLRDLLAEPSDKAEFSSYLRNVVRQADCPQAFSEATLTTSGLWSCGAGVMPPIAQAGPCVSNPSSVRFLGTGTFSRFRRFGFYSK